MATEAKSPAEIRLRKVEAVLTEAEKYAQSRKVPYLDFIVSLWKQHGTKGITAIILSRCAGPYNAGSDSFRDYVCLEMNKQYHMALSAGYSNLLSFKYTKEDVDYAINSLRKIMEALK
jgi:hypothetical protein